VSSAADHLLLDRRARGARQHDRRFVAAFLFAEIISVHERPIRADVINAFTDFRPQPRQLWAIFCWDQLF
jgi:hypothetical protein